VQKNQEADTFTFTTTPVHFEDTFNDIRQKIDLALHHAIKTNRSVAEANEANDLIAEFKLLNMILNWQTEEKTTESVI